MSIFTDIIANINSMGSVGERNSHAVEQLLNQANVSLRTANSAQNEVTTLSQRIATSGNYTLTVNAPAFGVNYTTANIAYNANAATVAVALDTASPASVPDGETSVVESGSAGISDGTVTLTHLGVLGTQGVLVTIDQSDLSGGTAVTVTRTTKGQPARNALQALFELGVITGTVHDTLTTPSDWTIPAQLRRPARLETIKLLMDAVVVEDGVTNVRPVIKALYPEL